MDFVKKIAGSHGVDSNVSKDSNNYEKQNNNQNNNESFASRISSKLNTVAGGGRESEKNEDLLDKETMLFSIMSLFFTSSTHVCEEWPIMVTIANEYSCKGIDLIQERILGQGKQDNESAIEQRKDEAISDAIRKGYKNMSGREFPIKDKPTKF